MPNSSKLALALVCLAFPFTAQADVLTFSPLQDNTIYSNQISNSNGAGETFFSGRGGGSSGLRRGLIQFDVSAIPADVQIDRVTLRLTLQDVASQETQDRNHSLFRLLESWGESSSDAGSSMGSGNGAAAANGDATWNARFYDPTTPTLWTTPGGEFNPAASAATLVGILDDIGTTYTWETLRGGAPTGLVADVEAWLGNPAANYGWLLQGDESTTNTVRRFYSGDGTNALLFPQLEIEFSQVRVPEPGSLLMFTGLIFGALFLTRRRK